LPIANFRLLIDYGQSVRADELELSFEPAFEIKIKDNTEEEDAWKADGNDMVVNFDIRHTHASYTSDVRLRSESLRVSQIGNRKSAIGTCLTPFLRAPYSGRSVV
jgi:hypothetical protein